MSKIIYCNKCGKTLDTYDMLNIREMSGKLGYGSKYDGAKFEIDFCVDCFDKLLESCKISPIDDWEEYLK